MVILVRISRAEAALPEGSVKVGLTDNKCCVSEVMFHMIIPSHRYMVILVRISRAEAALPEGSVKVASLTTSVV